MRPHTEQDYHERMLRVLVHIQEHLDDVLSLKDLAAIAHFSPYHFHRIFQGMVGESVMSHVRRLRLERAAARLKHTDQSVTHIAFEAGYEAHEAFTRAFRGMFAQSPVEFREVHQSLPFPPAPSGVHYTTAGDLQSFTPFSGGTPMDAEIKNCEAMRVAFMRHVGPYAECGETWQKLCAWAGPKRLIGPNSVFLGMSHDDPEVTPPDKIRYDACITVDERTQGEGDVGIQTVPAGEYAVALHRGPYEDLSKTYAAMCGQWIPAQGREMGSCPSVEIYKNSPDNTAPADLLTEVRIPLEPA